MQIKRPSGRGSAKIPCSKIPKFSKNYEAIIVDREKFLVILRVREISIGRHQKLCHIFNFLIDSLQNIPNYAIFSIFSALRFDSLQNNLNIFSYEV